MFTKPGVGVIEVPLVTIPSNKRKYFSKWLRMKTKNTNTNEKRSFNFIEPLSMTTMSFVKLSTAAAVTKMRINCLLVTTSAVTKVQPYKNRLNFIKGNAIETLL